VRELELAGLELRDVESLREHYPLTLRRWLANLAAGRERAVAEAGEERERVWRLYMTGAARSFERGEISVHQVLAAAPGAPHGLPLTRPWGDRFDVAAQSIKTEPVLRARHAEHLTKSKSALAELHEEGIEL
jgi:hypothetical protein